jgi:hypothetical protein
MHKGSRRLLYPALLVACLALLPVTALGDGITNTLKIGEASNGGINHFGTLASYNGSALNCTTDASGETTTCQAPSSGWFISSTPSGNDLIVAVLDEEGSDTSQANWSDLLVVTPTQVILYSDPQTWSSVLGDRSKDGTVVENHDPTIFCAMPDCWCSGYPHVDGYNGSDAYVYVYSDVNGTDTTVPEPGTLMLFGTGLLSMAGVIRRKLSA